MTSFSPALLRQGRWLAAPALLVVLAGCGQPGQAQSAGGGTPSRHTAVFSASAGVPEPGPSAAPTLATLDPCAVLSPVDRSTAGLSTFGKAKKVGETRGCDWTEPGAFGVSVTVDEKSGLADLEIARKTAAKTKVGAHQALRVSDKKAADGTCSVLLGVGAAASVQIDVSNTSFTDTALACSRANTVAGLVEPKLP
ncbi:DUF3558 family protein [Amycolatopsis sp. H20-H5]|uniref:DUF3558 family protein n=1 Tax=Amycolatopsis sp. H20-H5 TaxID=3046309 RepID=UPI002DBC592D|nr:DUF3558 family protein [Amycolatopsis sp. H20-H5]MEC3977656.1 DUF3558 family protein [Amycolatopsis sp. H20-H5]